MRSKLFLLLVLAATLTCQAGKQKAYLLGLRLQPVREQLGATALVDALHDKKQPKGFMKWTVNGQHTLASPIDEQSYLVHINNMRYWSPDDPVTYTIGLMWGEESLSRTFGIHDLASHRGHISVNDTTYMLRGLAEEALPIGEGTTEQQWRDFFGQIKAEGFIFVTLRSHLLTQVLLDAADHSGMLIHTTRTEAPLPVVTADKKKKKKKTDAPVVILTMEEQWGNHPSLCMLTNGTGSGTGIAGRMLRTHVFNPEQAERKGHLMDYAQLVDTTGICLADLSRLSQPDSLDRVLERTLCTEGVGGIVFASREQAKALKPLMIMGKTDRDYWDSSMSMRMNLYVANTTRNDFTHQNLTWQFTDQNGEAFSDGHAGNLRFDPLSSDYEAEAFSPMANVFPGTWVTLTVKMDGTDQQRSWRTKIGYPARIRYMNEQVHARLREWCKIRPGESREQYAERVNPVTKNKQKKLYSYEVATEMAGNILEKMAIRLTPYDRGSGTVTVSTVKGVPAFKLRVPQEEAESFCNAGELELRNTQFGLSNKDEYKIAYTEVYNTRTGACFVYDDRGSDTLERLFIDDKYVTEEVRERVEQEDSTLQQIKKFVVKEAERAQFISDNTQLSVHANVLMDYDEKGDTQNNYQIVFDYHVDARYSLVEDFGPGRYHIEDSHAALSMLKTVTTAFAQGFGRYIVPGKRLEVVITGSADASPIRSAIRYDGCYGHFQNHPYFLGEEEGAISIDPATGITENEQLAFLRAQGVHDYLSRNLTATEEMDVDYRFDIELPKGRGSQYRRIRVAFIFVDAFK